MCVFVCVSVCVCYCYSHAALHERMSARRGGATEFALCGVEAFTCLSFCLQTNARTHTRRVKCIRVRVLVLACLCVCDLVAHDNVNHSTPFVAAWLHFFRCSLPAWVGHSLSLSVRVCVCVCKCVFV